MTRLIRERNSGVTKKDLEKLDGRLNWAAPAIYPGKAMLRSLQQVLHLDLIDYNDRKILRYCN